MRNSTKLENYYSKENVDGCNKATAGGDLMPGASCQNDEQLFSLAASDRFPTIHHNITIDFTMLLGQVSFPGLWRVVMHSQYLSMNGMISCRGKRQTEKYLDKW